jgi:hypothetical protein
MFFETRAFVLTVLRNNAPQTDTTVDYPADAYARQPMVVFICRSTIGAPTAGGFNAAPGTPDRLETTDARFDWSIQFVHDCVCLFVAGGYGGAPPNGERSSCRFRSFSFYRRPFFLVFLKMTNNVSNSGLWWSTTR